MRRIGLRWIGAVLLAAAIAPACAAIDALVLSEREPRAYGYSVGDLVTRRLTIDAPARLALDPASLPAVGGRGQALELHRVDRRERREGSGRRYEIELAYQIFYAPREVRTLEMPSFALRFSGTPRAEELRIEAWPVTVAPLLPTEVSPRRGLGELQPDRPPPPIDTVPIARRVAVWLAAIGLLLAYLAGVYWGLPWWSRRHRPFARAWAALRATPAADDAPAQARAAIRQLHEALNRTAGQALFEPGIARFLAAEPRYEPLRAELARFFCCSREVYFGSVAAGPQEARWLLDFCRRCRDLERGSAREHG